MAENQEKKKDLKIFMHRLVPKHVILNKKDSEEVLKKYHVEAFQFPYIKMSDPALEGLDLKVGDLVKIERKSPTAGEVVAYRYVIEA